MGGFANNAPIVTDGLVFYVDAGNGNSYPGSGGTWTDLVGGNDGSFNNMDDINNPSNSYDSGNGGSIVFDGTDDYITIPQSVGDLSQNPMTTEHWVKFDNFNSGGDMLLMDRTSYNGSNGIETFILGSPKVVSVRGSGGTKHDGSTVISTGVWTHICIVFSGTTAYIYINGQLDNSGTIGAVQNSSYNMHLGHYPSLHQYNFDGNWATCLIYHKALSASEVLQNYNALKNRFV